MRPWELVRYAGVILCPCGCLAQGYITHRYDIGTHGAFVHVTVSRN